MEYPKEYKECPVCRSKDRIIESETLEEASKGHVRTGTRIPCIHSQTTIFSADMAVGILAPREIPMILGYFDVCADCGTLYCVYVDKKIGTVTPEIRRDNHEPRIGYG